MKKPENLKQLQSFLGLVTFYYDMWPQWSHVLTPIPTYFLQQNTSSQIEQDVTFLCMKSLVIQDTLLVFPDPNKPFLIETDASEYQLGAVIKQHNSMKHARHFLQTSHKLTLTQQNYTTIEKELLSIVKVFKEFCQMLLGSKIAVYTDHKI